MLTNILPAGSRARSVAIGAAVGVAVILFTQVVLPGTGDGRGTATAILFRGLVLGLINGLVAASIILVYRTTRIINFAATAIGAAGAELTFQLIQFTRVPFVLALIGGLIVSTLLGLVFDLAFGRRFFSAPRLVLTVVTIAVAGLLAGPQVRQAVGSLPFFPQERSFIDAVGGSDIRPFLPFPGFRFQVGDLSLNFGFAEIFAIDAVLLAFGLLAAFFRFTRAGVGVRALAENSERAPLLGISVGSLSSIVWALAGLTSGLAIIATGFVDQPGAASGIAPSVLLPSLAACAIARFTSLPTALAAAIGISIVARATEASYPDDLPLVSVALFLVIGGAFLLQRRSGRSEEGAGVSWQATEELRPVPSEFSVVGSIRAAKVAFIVIGLAAVIVYPFVVSTGAIVLGGVIAITTMLALSVVVLTGWAGQVSLGQWGFAAVGAVIGGSLTSKAGVPFWFAAPIAAGVTAAFAVLVGLPALRIRGLFLLVSTFAFALAVNSSLLNERYFGDIIPDDVRRPTFFFLDFDDERSMYYLTLGLLVLSIAVVLNLRRSRLGRLLIATRENDANVQAFGVPLLRTKLMAFALSGALAGLAGAIYVHQQRGINVEAFALQKSVDVFLLTVVGGVTSVGGALLGSAYFSVFDHLFPNNVVAQVLKPFSVLLVLYSVPGGLASILNSVRDAVLRIVAQRRQLIVPSLFADVDPEALRQRLIPLAEPDVQAVLTPAGVDERFALESELYVGRRRIGIAAAGDGERERAAISAAAESMQTSATGATE